MDSTRRNLNEATVELADGRVLGYAAYGNEEDFPVLALHSAPGWRGSDLDLPGFCVHVVERPGIGLSTRKPARRIGDWPADVAQFASALGMDRFAVVGTSAGGPYALAVACALPDRVVAVALKCSAGPRFDDFGVDEQFSARDAELVPLVRADPDRSAAAIPPFVKPTAEAWNADREEGWRLFLALMPPAQHALYEEHRDRWEGALDACYHDADAWADEIIAAYMPWGFDVRTIRVPVRAWHGAEDETVPLGHIRGLTDAIGAELSVVDGEGHYLSPAVDHEIAAWLRTVV